MNNIFEYEVLMSELERIKQQYEVVPFREWSKPGQVLLRHDVDLDLQKAVQLAEMERDIGLKATYFVLVSTHNYNPMGKIERKHIQKIKEAGHEIGLHFDPSLYEDKTREELISVAELEATILSLIVDEPITSISIHNAAVHHKHPLFPQFLNAYDPKIFSDEIYWSDSRGVIRKPIQPVLDQTDHGRTVQLLFHPIYYGPIGYQYETLLRRTVEQYATGLDDEYRINKLYDDQISKTSFLDTVFGRKL